MALPVSARERRRRIPRTELKPPLGPAEPRGGPLLLGYDGLAVVDRDVVVRDDAVARHRLVGVCDSVTVGVTPAAEEASPAGRFGRRYHLGARPGRVER